MAEIVARHNNLADIAFSMCSIDVSNGDEEQRVYTSTHSLEFVGLES